MARADVYKKKSIVNISKDDYTVNTGSVTRSGNTLNFSSNSRCTFSKSYTKKKPLTSSKLKVEYNLGLTGSDISTRYNNNIQINLNIEFYNGTYNESTENTKLTDGKKKTIQIIPYKNNENTGGYKFEEIELESNYIKSIDIIIAYYGSGSMRLNNLGIYVTVIGDESSVTEIDDDHINDLIEQYINDHPIQTDLIIPGLNAIPDISTVEDGFTFRLLTASTLPIGGTP